MGQSQPKSTMKSQTTDSDYFISPQETARSEEITIQVHYDCFNLVLPLLNSFKADLIASSEFITEPKKNVYIWLNDSGNRIRNAIESGLFGQGVSVLDTPLSRGTKKLTLTKLLSAYQFKYEIEHKIQKQIPSKIIAHSLISQSGVQCVFF
jgi:hypothetical protein